MPKRTLVEALHVAAGLVATVAVAVLSAWSYPQATDTITWVAVVAFLIVAAMGVRPLRNAWRADHAGGRADG